MKVRSTGEALNYLDDEFAWRRKELTEIWSDVKSSKPERRAARLRAASAILYAHWEGFVKAASETYVSYVSNRRLKHCQLCDGLLALALRSKLQELRTQNDVAAHIDFVRFVKNALDTRARIPKLGAIKTGANLSSRRFKSIVLTLGLNYSPFELKENMIDAQLVGWRNTIAHGRWACPKEEDFDVVYQETTVLLRNFKDQLGNAIVKGAYRQPNAEA